MYTHKHQGEDSVALLLEFWNPGNTSVSEDRPPFALT